MLESAVDVLTIINITPVASIKRILARHGTLMVVQMLGVDAQPSLGGVRRSYVNRRIL
jgi:hypothetical protein